MRKTTDMVMKMGTDVIMKWKGATPEDVQKEEHAILRAAIWQIPENDVLKHTLPNECWDEVKEFHRVYFDEKFEDVKEIADAYLRGDVERTAFSDSGVRRYKIMSVMLENMKKKLPEKPPDKVVKMVIQIEDPTWGVILGRPLTDEEMKVELPTTSEADRCLWIQDFLKFWALGCKLEKEGKEPEVVIDH
ncbi:hypothetical protein GOV11_00810 [Candidatus Woesearchaeota archaeon]|nr:hypothetical protein [Candidatus Woesearchaeota archaeon]